MFEQWPDIVQHEIRSTELRFKLKTKKAMAKKLTELKSHLKKVQIKYNQLRQAVEDAETKISKKVVNTREAICDTMNALTQFLSKCQLLRDIKPT